LMKQGAMSTTFEREVPGHELLIKVFEKRIPSAPEQINLPTFGRTDDSTTGPERRRYASCEKRFSRTIEKGDIKTKNNENSNGEIKRRTPPGQKQENAGGEKPHKKGEETGAPGKKSGTSEHRSPETQFFNLTETSDRY